MIRVSAPPKKYRATRLVPMCSMLMCENAWVMSV